MLLIVKRSVCCLSVKSSKSGTTDGDLERAVSQFCEDIPVTAGKLLKVRMVIQSTVYTSYTAHHCAPVIYGSLSIK